ncbi:MAG TPA: MBL fold metallo-hydrolase [Thermoleophilaceae bacterium]|nr:MBL fold metallo-hydrolase [Thermoleophilaceae bacterium]
MAPVTRITYIGHATIQIEEGGTRLITDPVLRPRVAHLKRIVPPPALDDLREPDAVLISHAHHDHLDLPSLRLLAPRRVLVPEGYGSLLKRAGVPEVTEVRPDDRVRIGALEVLGTAASHDGRRLPWSAASAALGYLVQGAHRTFFAGDTEIFDGMERFADKLDLALLPIWGWGPRLGPGHMDPFDAARATTLLEPRVAIPIHWGTYASPTVKWRGDPSKPARAFERVTETLAPWIDVRVLAPGASTSIESALASSETE